MRDSCAGHFYSTKPQIIIVGRCDANGVDRSDADRVGCRACHGLFGWQPRPSVCKCAQKSEVVIYLTDRIDVAGLIGARYRWELVNVCAHFTPVRCRSDSFIPFYKEFVPIRCNRFTLFSDLKKYGAHIPTSSADLRLDADALWYPETRRKIALPRSTRASPKVQFRISSSLASGSVGWQRPYTKS